MKEKEGFVDCPEQQLILFVEKDDGTYGPMQTGSFLTKNYIDDYYEKRQRLEASLKKQVKEREISPVAYYMTLEDLSPAETALRVGISQRKVKKHMLPGKFEKIAPSVLKKYAEVFNVPVTSLVELPDS
jgi:hypothetical protein